MLPDTVVLQLDSPPTASTLDFAERVQEYHLETPLEAYDLNFVFRAVVLESDRVRLEPLIPSLHGRDLYEKLSTSPDIDAWRYMLDDPPTSLAGYLTYLEWIRQKQTSVCFAVFDKQAAGAGSGRLAGVIGYYGASKDNLNISIGPVIVLSEHQRTYVQSHASGLMLRYAFEKLGMLNVSWEANSLNDKSIAAATRLGFQERAIMPFAEALSVTKEGAVVPGQAKKWRHDWGGSITFLEWEDVVECRIARLMS